MKPGHLALLLVAGCSGSSIPDLGTEDAGHDALPDVYVEYDSGQDAGLDADAGDTYDASDGWANPLDQPCDPGGSNTCMSAKAPDATSTPFMYCFAQHSSQTPHDMYGRCTFTCNENGKLSKDYEATCLWLGGQCLQPNPDMIPFCIPDP